MKVCHITSVHSPEDIRIFHKECVSLAKAGYDVSLVEQGKSYEKNKVHIIGMGKIPARRIARILFSPRKAYNVAKSVNADVYHLHDPELLPYGVKLKRKGKKVIFDSHEDVPAQIMDKVWIPKLLRKAVSKCYRFYETYAVRKFDAVVTATPHIAKGFEGRCSKVVVVNNYPKLDDIEFHETSFSQRSPIVCYAGGIDDLRGEKIMVEAMQEVEGTLVLAGDHEILEYGERVKYIGRQNRKGINELYGSAVAGLCILKPIENYYYSKPIKIYEYMAAGLPYICSDFPGWRRVAEESGAGICVDPENIAEIRKAITFLLQNREKAQRMGNKGREYVAAQCNWENEEKSLIYLYEGL